MINLYKKLKQKGILSINKRNADFVLPYNQRKLYPIVDDKLQSKKLAQAHNIAVPELYLVIKTEHQISQLAKLLEPYDSFVIKPAHGAGGDGIIVIQDRVKNYFRKVSGELISIDDLAYHLSLTLSGAYSLGGLPDHALIEHRVIVDKVFQGISHQGVPDVRVISFLGYPAMAMLRTPTRMSDGKANLHQGAIGVGIDLATGKTCGGVIKNDPIDFHPDTLNPLQNIQIPYWNEILNLSAGCFELTGLGYLGVDIVIDEKHGPLMLELNARPGLNIQIANQAGLVHRYEKIIAQSKNNEDVEQRVEFSKKVFTALVN